MVNRELADELAGKIRGLVRRRNAYENAFNLVIEQAVASHRVTRLEEPDLREVVTEAYIAHSKVEKKPGEKSTKRSIAASRRIPPRNQQETNDWMKGRDNY